MTDTLRATPGVQATAYTWGTPLTGFAPKAVVHSLAQSHIDRSITINYVSDGYFSTMQTRLLSGREFAADDRDQSTCVLNEAAARVLFPHAGAIGESLQSSSEEGTHLKATCRVVGLVEDAIGGDGFGVGWAADEEDHVVGRAAGKAFGRDGEVKRRRSGLAQTGVVRGYLYIRRLLYGASPADLGVAFASLLVLIAVALLAAAIPARRAASLDPTRALRIE